MALRECFRLRAGASLGYVERLKGGGYRWLPHSYQLNL